jgi:shikimate dehydrogenase
MNKFGLIGERLGHSFSPLIHSRLGAYEYRLCPLKREELESFMLNTELDGFNVTIPYKLEVIPYLSELSDRARKIGSVNTPSSGCLTAGFTGTIRITMALTLCWVQRI